MTLEVETAPDVDYGRLLEGAPHCPSGFGWAS